MPYPGFQAFFLIPSRRPLRPPSQAPPRLSPPLGGPPFPHSLGQAACSQGHGANQPPQSREGGCHSHTRGSSTPAGSAGSTASNTQSATQTPASIAHKAGGTTHHRTCTTPHHPWASSLPGLTQTPTSRTAPLCASQGYPVTSALDADNAAKDIVPLTLSLPASAPPPVCRSSPAKQKGGRSPEHNTTFRLHNL